METPKRVVLDTDIIVDHLRGKAPRDLFRQLEEKSELATTVINAFELYYGAYKSRKTRTNLASVKGFLSTIAILEQDDASAEKAGQILAELEERGNPIDPRDLFIGCVALTRGFSVLTNNRRHLERVRDLLVLSPSDIQQGKA